MTDDDFNRHLEEEVGSSYGPLLELTLSQSIPTEENPAAISCTGRRIASSQPAGAGGSGG